MLYTIFSKYPHGEITLNIYPINIIRTLFIAVFVFAFFTLQALPQQPNNVESKNFLWSVKSDSNTVYLLGSLHVLGKESYPLGDAYEKAFQNSQVLVFEVDPGELEKPETIQMVLEKSAIEKGKTLKDTVSPKTYELAKSELGDMGVDIKMFTYTRPWFVAVTTTILKLSKMGFNPEYGVDKYFYQKAQKSGKEIIGLETAEFQIDLIASLGGESQDEVLLHTLKDLDVIEVELPGLVGSWQTGDSKKFQQLILKSYGEHPGVYQRLIVDRNNNWLKAIEGYLKSDKNYLLVVGAGHLVGNEGLVKLLSDKGYKVEQM